LLPGVGISTVDGGGAPAFFAVGGIFVEPSMPTYPYDLDPASAPNVVDAARSMLAGTVGMRASATQEDIHFVVRRVRRWHGQQAALSDAFQPLRFAYEIRRGRLTAFSRDSQQYGLVTAAGFTMDWSTVNDFAPDVWNDGQVYDGTNLGGFDDENVNINPGDFFRLLDDEGNLLAEAVVAEVLSATQLKLEPAAFPGETEANVFQAWTGGRRFEVWLRQAPVPHEQSNEQLLNLITDQVVFESVADRSDPDPQNWTGGYVPELVAAADWAANANQLFDDSGVDFVDLGIRVGDIVVIDPAGTLPVVDERGASPLGDRSVPTRTVSGVGAVNPYTPGAVSELDDNRGFYRELGVEADHLVLDPVHTFAGTLGQDVIFGGTQTDLYYAIYPTVSLSVLNVDPTGEGQNDLRPTRKAVGTSYLTGVPVQDAHSLRPFSYRVLRPSPMFGTELVDMVLTMRERMLSLIELFRGAATGTKGGFYWDWQDQEHVEDLGTPTDPYSGLGLFPNRLITTIVGEMGVSPVANTSDCLSILDRRFWVLDTRLDLLEPNPTNALSMRPVTGAVPFPEQGGPYTAYNDLAGGSEVRPVLPDHLKLILDVRDRLRAIRYTWLTYRTHRYIGTLARISAFEDQLQTKLEDRVRALLLEQTAAEVTG
jgi:hypothetical protein